MEQAVIFEVGEVVQGTVASIAEKLSFMTDADLQALIELEKAGEKRKSLLADINKEIERRADLADSVSSNARTDDVPDEDGATGDGDAGPDAGDDATGGAGTENQNPDDEGDDDDADPEVDLNDAPESSGGPIVLSLPDDRDALFAAALDGLSDGVSIAIVMADADGALVNVPPVEVTQSLIGMVPGGLLYLPEINLGEHLPAVAVRQFFLVNRDAVPFAVCRLGCDLHAGGGRKAQVPSRNLKFALG